MGVRIPGAQLAQLARMATSMGDDRRRDLGALAQLVQNAEVIGPPDPPRIFRPLFDDVGQRHGLPPLLLAAVAGVLSDFDPALEDDRVGVGLMALPCVMAGTDRHTAAVDQLLERDGDAAAAVRRNVDAAAAYLVGEAERSPAGLAGALTRYVEAGRPPGRPALEARQVVALIGATFALYLARSSDVAGTLEQLTGAA